MVYLSEIKKDGTLSQLVLENIQNSIRDGEFRPGSTLPSEREMSERYKVGKSSVREAIKMLQVLGVVEASQGRGTYLRESLGPQILRPLLFDMMLQRTSADELFEFRLIFDAMALKLGASKASEKTKEALKNKFLEFKALSEAQLDAAYKADLDFHMIILNSTENQFLIKMGTMILELCNPYLKKSSTVFDADVIASHERIVQLFCSGDVSEAENAVEGATAVFRKSLDTCFKYKN